MSEEVLQGLEIGAGLVGETRGSVAQMVPPDLRESGALDEFESAWWRSSS